MKHYFPNHSVLSTHRVALTPHLFPVVFWKPRLYNRWQIVCLTNVLVGQAKEVAVGTAAVGEEGGGEHSSR